MATLDDQDSYRSTVCLAIVTATTLLCSAVAGSTQSAQTPPVDRSFEVASVKPSLSPFEAGRAAAGGGATTLARFGIETQPGGRFKSNVTLKQLIAYAFDVKDYQIEAGPPWLASDFFDVTASAGPDATVDDIRGMVRTLLAARFGLRTHSGTRQASLYALTMARADGRFGPGLNRPTPECVQQIEERKAGAPVSRPAFNPDNPLTPLCGMTTMRRTMNGASMLSFGGMDLTALVRQISSEFAAPVIDRTGLTGLFDITLEFMSARAIGGRAPGLDPNSTDPVPLPLEAALPAQLGLKLEKEIGPMPLVVIDAAARPTPD